MKLAIIIPAYNEEKRITKTLKNYSSYFNKLSKKEKFSYNLLIVVNASTDSTLDIVKKYKKKNPSISFLNLKNPGKGNAVISGFNEAVRKNFDIIGFVDADMATSPEAFHLLLKELNSYDGVIGSRYIPGAVMSPKPGLKRIIVSRIFNFLARAMFLMPYRDTQCGAKIFRLNALEKSLPKLTMSQWAFDVELIYTLRKLGYIIKESPTSWSDQKYSNINFMKAGPKMALGIINLRILNSPFKSLFPKGLY